MDDWSTWSAPDIGLGRENRKKNHTKFLSKKVSFVPSKKDGPGAGPGAGGRTGARENRKKNPTKFLSKKVSFVPSKKGHFS